MACLYIVAGFSPFFPFFLFFSVFLCSACRGGSCPVLACCGSWSVAGGLTFLYVRLGYPWQALALLACRGFLAPVFTLSRVAVCRCCRFCRFVCVCDCMAVCVCLYQWQALTLSRGVCFELSRGVCGSQAFEQVFDKGRSNKFSKQGFDSQFESVCQNFQPNPDRIFCFFWRKSNRILTESDRIFAVSLQPNL